MLTIYQLNVAEKAQACFADEITKLKSEMAELTELNAQARTGITHRIYAKYHAQINKLDEEIENLFKCYSNLQENKKTNRSNIMANTAARANLYALSSTVEYILRDGAQLDKLFHTHVLGHPSNEEHKVPSMASPLPSAPELLNRDSALSSELELLNRVFVLPSAPELLSSDSALPSAPEISNRDAVLPSAPELSSIDSVLLVLKIMAHNPV